MLEQPPVLWQQRLPEKWGIFMNERMFGPVESRFADIVWANAPMTTRELVNLCEKELEWKRTTTYTVLKKMCDRGIFEMKEHGVRVLIPREEFYAVQSRQFVEDNFQGSLPAFIAAFASSKAPSKKELEEIARLVEAYKETCL